MTPDLFNYQPPARYPAAPGFKDRDTSRKAAEHVACRAELLRSNCLEIVRASGQEGCTADEAATDLGESVLSVRPRFTELLKLGKITDSGLRRRNASGRSAKVWRVA
jgi:predicted ArsR family transcriptional regulator